ncbi:MAG: hypothetical protein ACFB21_09560, partial [Opitutales bacterium]
MVVCKTPLINELQNSQVFTTFRQVRIWLRIDAFLGIGDLAVARSGKQSAGQDFPQPPQLLFWSHLEKYLSQASPDLSDLIRGVQFFQD